MTDVLLSGLVFSDPRYPIAFDCNMLHCVIAPICSERLLNGLLEQF